MLEDNMICIRVPELDFAQGLDLSHRQRDFSIYTDDVTVVCVHDTQSGGLLIWAFFSGFARMLQLAVVAQLPLVADFLDPRDGQGSTLNDGNGGA